MSKQVTLNINQTFDKKLKVLEQKVEDKVRDKLVAIAETAVASSPVDTGAYVTSHSFKTNTSSRGRGKSSFNKPRNQDPQAKRQEGFNNLVSDINKLDLKTTSKITLRNDSPHAQAVEYKHGYYVYAQVRNLHG